MSGWKTAKQIIDQLGVTDKQDWHRIHNLVRLIGEEPALALLEPARVMAGQGDQPCTPSKAFISLARAAAGETAERYPWGIDYEWYEADAVGHVAAFTTAGVGPMPMALLEIWDIADEVMDDLWRLPTRGGYELLVTLNRPDDFIDFARHGLFAYDWADVHRTSGYSHQYECYSKPENPIRVEEMPEEFRVLFEAVRFPSIRFADSLCIDVRALTACVPRV